MEDSEELSLVEDEVEWGLSPHAVRLAADKQRQAKRANIVFFTFRIRELLTK